MSAHRSGREGRLKFFRGRGKLGRDASKIRFQKGPFLGIGHIPQQCPRLRKVNVPRRGVAIHGRSAGEGLVLVCRQERPLFVACLEGTLAVLRSPHRIPADGIHSRELPVAEGKLRAPQSGRWVQCQNEACARWIIASASARPRSVLSRRLPDAVEAIGGEKPVRGFDVEFRGLTHEESGLLPHTIR